MVSLEDLRTEEKKVICVSVDVSVADQLEELKERKKLKKVSPLINELLKEWLSELSECVNDKFDSANSDGRPD